jgi:hypothetical protein
MRCFGRFFEPNGVSSKGCFGGSGVSTQPSGFSNTSAIYDGIGYSFSIICSRVKRCCDGSLSRIFSAVQFQVRIFTDANLDGERTGKHFFHPLLPLFTTHRSMEKRAQYTVHASHIAWRPGGTCMTERSGDEWDIRPRSCIRCPGEKWY